MENVMLRQTTECYLFGEKSEARKKKMWSAKVYSFRPQDSRVELSRVRMSYFDIIHRPRTLNFLFKQMVRGGVDKIYINFCRRIVSTSFTNYGST